MDTSVPCCSGRLMTSHWREMPRCVEDVYLYERKSALLLLNVPKAAAPIWPLGSDWVSDGELGRVNTAPVGRMTGFTIYTHPHAQRPMIHAFRCNSSRAEIDFWPHTVMRLLDLLLALPILFSADCGGRSVLDTLPVSDGGINAFGGGNIAGGEGTAPCCFEIMGHWWPGRCNFSRWLPSRRRF